MLRLARTVGMRAVAQSNPGICFCSYRRTGTFHDDGGSSSSSDAGAFDIAALAARLQVGQRQVKRVIESLHEEGLHNYGEEEHISKVDAQIIAEYGFGRRLPPPRYEPKSHLHSKDSIEDGTCSFRRDAIVEDDDAAERITEIVDAILHAKQGQCHRATGLIKKQGIHVPSGGGKGTRYELIPFDPSTGKDFHSEKLTIGTNGLRGVLRNHTGRVLGRFIAKHRRPGMLKCDRCGVWGYSELQPGNHGYMDGCLGFCGRS